jgi:hypothetical protein
MPLQLATIALILSVLLGSRACFVGALVLVALCFIM